MDNTIAVEGFSALASESRMTVLQTLVKAGPQGLAVGEIQRRTGIPASTLAHHLKFLYAGHLVKQDKQGRTIINRADFDHLEALASFILEECCADQISEAHSQRIAAND